MRLPQGQVQLPNSSSSSSKPGPEPGSSEHHPDYSYKFNPPVLNFPNIIPTIPSGLTNLLGLCAPVRTGPSPFKGKTVINPWNHVFSLQIGTYCTSVHHFQVNKSSLLWETSFQPPSRRKNRHNLRNTEILTILSALHGCVVKLCWVWLLFSDNIFEMSLLVDDMGDIKS